ncbi:ABC transporter permease [Corynebacterium marinum]|uniref:ABC lipoprotein transporter, permease protein n=1 Tax=Corynebacterium marinum DSM 44953 TaxID=1224162 RepID=A0A0B6TQF4_9CORY|nr:FtsX-like permease family protein [Corynebacterium marinum]AJK68484.1 ABC lipoprotein transporter, permease protein [Corynebacterium marinum DSM 44953]
MSSSSALRRVSLRSLSAHRLRLLLTALAVVLGTSFVAGAFMLTATLGKAFDDITEANYDGVDVVLVTSAELPLTLGVAGDIEARNDVAKVESIDQLPVILLGAEGNPVQTGGAGSWLLAYLSPGEAVSPPLIITQGTPPAGEGRAVLNEDAAASAGLEVGDTVTVIDSTGRHEFTLDGLTRFEAATGGWAGLQIPAEQFRAEFTDGVHTGRIAVRAEGGDPESLRQSLAAAYPGATVMTGEDAAAADSEEISSQLAFFTYILFAFGLIALLVGTFIISNTFSMIVAQRTREFALLRALGMSRPQLSGSVMVEAALVAVLGSAVGILVGVGLVELIMWAMTAAGFGFPDAGLGLDAASILVPLGIGIVVTVLSAWVPARRAGRVHPVQAMRSGDQSVAVPLRVRTVIGAVLLVAGLSVTLVAALATGWDTAARGILTGAGTVGIVLGVLLVMAVVARSMFRARFRLGGVITLLARTNLSRNPRRTAATAFALTLGVALVAAVGILGASMKESVFGRIDESLRADAVVSTGMVNLQGVPEQAVAELAGIDGVAAVTPVTLLPVEVDGVTAGTVNTTGVSPLLIADPQAAIALEVVQGSFGATSDTPGVGLSRSTAEDLGLAVGDNATVSAPSLGRASVTVPVLVIWEDSDSYTPVAVTVPVGEQLVPDRSAWFTQNVFVTFAGGADEEVVFGAVTDQMNTYGVLQVMDRYQYRDAAADQVNQLMSVVYALLALSVVIAVLGIVNTLALSTTERHHEFGMLRAVGTQRSQIRRMIVLESAVIALYGAVVGVVVGVWLGWCLVRILSSQGIDRLLVPWDQALLLVLGAVAVGAVAGLWPARRAARTTPLSAVG